MRTAGHFKLAAALAVILFTVSASFAQELPKIAVYVTGANEQGTNKALSTQMLSALVNNGKYQAVERSEEFLDKLDAEHLKQRNGAIDDGQISALGRQFGVKFVCIADITPALGSNQVSARIVDVETAGVVAMGHANSPLATLDNLTDASDNIVSMMFGEKTNSAQKTAKTQTDVSQAQPDAPKGRKLDYYIAGRYVLPVGGMPALAANAEGGLVWGNGMFLGLDVNFGHNEHSEKRDGRVMMGGSFNLGSVYDLPVENLQLVYGGAAVFLFVTDMGDSYSDGEYQGDVSFLAPFIKLRWKFIELSYRGLLGVSIVTVGDYDNNYEDATNSYGFSWNHQIMLGVYFATSKRTR